MASTVVHLMRLAIPFHFELILPPHAAVLQTERVSTKHCSQTHAHTHTQKLLKGFAAGCASAGDATKEHEHARNRKA